MNENIIEQGSPDEQALGDAMLMNDFELEEGSPEAANEPAMEAEAMEEQIEARPNASTREVNVEVRY